MPKESIKLKSARLCFVGNMLGKNAGYIPTQGQILAELFAADGYRVTSVSAKINRLARMREILATLIKHRRNFDVVLLEVYSGLYFVIADLVGRVCQRFNIPLIMMLHGGSLPELIERHPHWTERVFGRADALAAPSEYLARKIGIKNREIQIITNTINLDEYFFRQRSEIAPRLIWMRSFHPIYNPEMAVEVLARLRQSVPEATLTMAGIDKGLEPEIKMLVSQKGLSEVVRFAGFLDMKGKIDEFSKADIYLNTNRVDNMPVSVIEARALGLPVIATDVGGLRYLIEDGENGFLVPNEDVEAMVEAIKKLLLNSDLTRRISGHGRDLAERSAWNAVRADWENLITRVLEKKDRKRYHSVIAGKELKPENINN